MSRLTRRNIADIVGDIDDIKAAEIIATGATVEELEEAVAWASGITRVGQELRRPLSGNVARVYDILTADQYYGEEEP